jgi:hypothetical protein
MSSRARLAKDPPNQYRFLNAEFARIQLESQKPSIPAYHTLIGE